MLHVLLCYSHAFVIDVLLIANKVLYLSIKPRTDNHFIEVAQDKYKAW